jgi:hypothetical protein
LCIPRRLGRGLRLGKQLHRQAHLRVLHPRQRLASTDASDFCGAFDRQVARAAELQSTDPPAAAALWARLDRQLTDLAIWLPTVTPNETDLIPSRAHNDQYNPVWGALIDQLSVR